MRVMTSATAAWLSAPLLRAATTTRWPSTGTAKALTSSGSTNSRPARAARAFAAPMSCRVARGLAPRRSSSVSRVDWAIETMYCSTAGLTKTLRTVSIMRSS